MLQQVLFYRELGFDLGRIKRTLGRADFEKTAALLSHREVLQKNLLRIRKLMETIDRTITHLDGTKRMEGEEMFVGFSVGTGTDRFNENIRLDGEPNNCKVSAQDTDGSICVFEFTGTSGGPRHLHHDQDEWVCVVKGEFDFEVGDEKRCLRAGESIFLPRKVPHVWACLGNKPGKIINVYQPAGRMEEFFREVGKYDSKTFATPHRSTLGNRLLHILVKNDANWELTGFANVPILPPSGAIREAEGEDVFYSDPTH
jgi:mannose-6-phosphate isomerase-like protein (cupin superfamily)